jgi:uncharacterized membrane protein
MDLLIEILAIVVTGPMVGSEIAVAAFMHPTLARLADDEFRAARSASSGQLGRVMPFWYAATLVLLVFACFVVPAGYPTWLVGGAAVLMTAVLALTIAVLVPINNRVAAYPAGQPADRLRRLARRWDRLHWVRVALLLVLFVLLVVGTAGAHS